MHHRVCTSFYQGFTEAIFASIELIQIFTYILPHLNFDKNDPHFLCFYFQATSQQKKEAKLARILILIVFFFMACNSCKLILTLYDLGSMSLIRTCDENNLQFKSPIWVTVLISVNHLFLTMNASANIFLFMVTGTQVSPRFFS